MITLFIIAAQNDFITGTRSFKSAKNVLEPIKKFIKTHKDEIEKIIFICEWHPHNHMSFKKYGGELPPHCVQYTPGSCIEPKLLKYINSMELNYDVCLTGELEEVEVLGGFNDVDFANDTFSNRVYFDNTGEANMNSDFVVCGVGQNVLYTLDNMLKEDIHPKVFFSGIIDVDGTQKLSKFIKENKLEKIN